MFVLCVCVCTRAHMCAEIMAKFNIMKVSTYQSFPLKILLFQLMISPSKHLKYYTLIFYCVMTSSKLILLL